jgi:signal peptidase I
MKQSQPRRNELAGIRETVESIWVAIILAFVLRAFVVEAFVIPTGSMATHLLGQHVLLRCSNCLTQFPFGIQADVGASGQYVTGPIARCPNCGTEVKESQAEPKSGDRVLVLKYLYNFAPPHRWDVIVFKDPQENQQNYIKRLAGLPGEVVRIIQGDLFVHKLEDANHDGVLDENDAAVASDDHGPRLADLKDWHIARKPDAVQQTMWLPLFDNDYRPESWQTPRQQLWRADDSATGWDVSLEDGRVFQYDGSSEQRLHFAQDQADVFRAANAYNQSMEDLRRRPDPDEICGDLKLQTVLLPESPEGCVLFTLSHLDQEFAGEIRFDGRFRLLCRGLDQKDGRWDQAEELGATQQAPLAPGHAVQVALTHVDWKVALWVDGRAVLSTTDENYSPNVDKLVKRVEERDIPTPRVGLVGQAGRFQLWHTRIFRDVFYTCPNLQEPPDNIYGRYARENFLSAFKSPVRPRQSWGTTENPLALRAFADRPEMDEFFMLGDNSPFSQDSRLWVKAAPSLRLYGPDGKPQYRLGTAPRYGLIGKAFFVYWPSGYRLLDSPRLPIVPDVGKMRRIR